MESKSSELLKKYKVENVIGTGAYGEVYKGESIENGKKVAIKKVRTDSYHEGIPATTLREISLLKELSHPNIVRFIELVIEKRKLYLIFELMDADLKQYFDKHDESKKHIKSIAYQILCGIKEMHSKRMLHRDLKPKNILLNIDKEKDKVVAKIADFGLAKAFVVPFREYTNEVVTLWYRPPEILLGSKKYFTSLDMWSFGCILAEMVLKEPLFAGDSDVDQLFKIFDEFGLPNEKEWPEYEQLRDKRVFKSAFKGESRISKFEKPLADLLLVNS